MNYHHKHIAVLVLFWAVLSFSGCQCVQKQAEPLRPTPGWLTVSGSMMPTKSIPLHTHGCSLVDALALVVVPGYSEEEAPVTIQGKRHLARETNSAEGSDKEPDSEQPTLTSGLQRAIERATTSDDRDATVYEVAIALEEFLLENPQYSIPDTWVQGYPQFALDMESGGAEARNRLILTIESMADGDLKKAAFVLLAQAEDPKTSADQVEQSIDHLRHLTIERNIEPSQADKYLAWAFVTIERVRKDYEVKKKAEENRPIEAGTDRDEVSEKPSELSKLVFKKMQEEFKSLDGTNPNFEHAARSGGLVENEDQLMVIVQGQSPEYHILTYRSVFRSPLGDLWLMPGDRIVLAKLSELPYGTQLNGEKRVGLIGMIAQQGVWETQQFNARSVIGTWVDEIDPRTNLVTVTQADLTNRVIHLLLPLEVDSYALSRDTELNRIIEHWGLIDGTVFRFDHLSTAPVIAASHRQRQRAMEAMLPTAVSRSGCFVDPVRR